MCLCKGKWQAEMFAVDMQAFCATQKQKCIKMEGLGACTSITMHMKTSGQWMRGSQMIELLNNAYHNEI